MVKGRKNIGIRIFLLAIFISYFTGISFFNHTHIVNGVTIVHSHFYAGKGKTESRKNIPSHHHPNNALTLIAQAAEWTATMHQVPEVPKELTTQLVIYPIKNISFARQAEICHFYLRGPPVRA